MALIKSIKETLNDGHKKGWSLEVRFIAAFLTLIIALLLAVGIVFASLGAFDFNSSKTAALFEHELNGITERIKTDFNTITSYSLALSENLSRELALRLDENNINSSEISGHQEILNDLLDSVFPIMSAEIRSMKSSGVFLILDATVNPALEGAEYSKSGIFIRNIAAQNNLSSAYYDLRYLYGPVSLAQSRKMAILPQWSLEYDVSAMQSYHTVIENARQNIEKPLSQLYYWTAKESDGGVDYGMYCCVPVIINDNVVGICGYEVSAMQFKVSYAPDVSGQDYSFCMLAPSDDCNIYFKNALFAGNYAVTAQQPSCTVKKLSGSGFLTYDCEASGAFAGNHAELPLYSASSVYAERGFSVVLLTPKAQIAKISRDTNMKYLGGLAVLLLLAVAAAIVLCRRNMKPVKKAFAEVRKSRSVRTEKTRVREIDDLFDFLSERDRENEDKLHRAEQECKDAIERQEKAAAEVETIHEIYKNEITPQQYAQFARNLHTLTEKECAIYNLYLQGKKAQDIAVSCGISINTVKFHNKNIYDKLGINSRKELLRYAMYKDGIL
ncbi:MAG: LuxR C-terminal-related transcriptional regulator [Eubacteriales bacterium]